MDKSNWHGLMQILEIRHIRGGEIIWQECNIKNILHTQGEEFLLRAAFEGGRSSSVIPDDYYVGLDNRSVVLATDTTDEIFQEPSTNGYVRQKIASSGEFTITEEDGHILAVGPFLSFEAVSGSWGPVQNVFLTDDSANDGYLISTAKLGTVVTPNSGDVITLRLSMGLRDCPPI